jgi:hypothetical protein
VIVWHKEQDITEYITSLSWGGSKSAVARKLELSVVNAPLDENIKPLSIELADPIYLFEDDGETEIFRGYIVDREAKSATGTVSYTAYDMLYYTLNSSATYNFKGNTAEEIARAVCNDMQIPVGELVSTGLKQKLIVQDKSLYEIIMQAYTQAHESNGLYYIVTAKKGNLNVEEMGKVVCEVELTEDTNILSSSYRESLNGMVNRVKIYNGSGSQVGVVENEDIKYGVFQKTYTKESGKDAYTTANSMFKGIEKTFTLECLNHNGAVTGAGAIIYDKTTGLKGLVWIESDTHTWSGGVAKMSLTVTLKEFMDTKDASDESKLLDESVTASKYGSEDNPPFSIIDKEFKIIKANIPTFREAYSYLMSNAGSSRGWYIYDGDTKRVRT